MTFNWIDPKKICRLPHTLLTGSLLTVVLGASATTQAMDLRFGHGGTAETAYQLGAERFSELLSDKTDGEISVTILGNSVMGHETEMFEQEMAGALDMAIVSPGLITDFSHSANIFSVPFLYRDVDHWQKILDGQVGQEIADRISQETGVKVLAYFGGGKREVVSTKPVNSLADLKGLKIRTNPTEPLIAAWQAIGVKPSVMAWKEIYTGLQLGAIDGLLNEPEWVLRMRFNEVAPHLVMTDHDITVRLLTMSEQTWERLNESEQQAVTMAARESAAYARKVQLKQDAEALESLVDQGMKLHRIDRDKMQEMVKEPLKKVVADMKLTDLYKMIKDVN